ncbi:unnamed protein product [Acanthoscelides obtectus]|uniref:Nuclease HARBI1 n=1 Tax=Acanthoscelides obtectus TaxID=200917 RepID=A0A9P0Q493_ACAOB|nr:unnamed protein product [Acanthoscelides obtectus]CAK1635790.1 Zinc finger MYM-type protein 6 [Acanthoscelides obtectus]
MKHHHGVIIVGNYIAINCKTAESGIAEELGCSQPTVSRIFHDVLERIVQQAEEFIRFPNTENQIMQAKEKWLTRFCFPTAIGVIDCTHIRLDGKPTQVGDEYQNPENRILSELILPAVEEVLKTVLHKPASDIIKRIPLSNNTVESRIDEIGSDIESFLCNYLQTTHFSIQLDESTLPDNAALLLAYVRFIMNQETYEKLLFARTLITDTKDFESRFEDILTMVIPPWMINPYGDIEETNVIIQEELTELSTNEELKVVE